MQSHLQWHSLSSVPTKPPLTLWSWTTRTSCIVYAANKDFSSSSSSQSQQEQYDFDFDKDKARQALQDLDKQLETMYEKQATAPAPRAAEDNLAVMEEMAEQERPDYSGSYLPYMLLALVAFTIFYNILFYSVIKPAVDGSDEPVLASASAPANISSQTTVELLLQNPSPVDSTQQ